jgi:hypothetical protein
MREEVDRRRRQRGSGCFPVETVDATVDNARKVSKPESRLATFPPFHCRDIDEFNVNDWLVEPETISTWATTSVPAVT